MTTGTQNDRYLKRAVERRGGVIERFKSPGRRHVPDWIVSDRHARIDFIETKATGERPRAGQLRDHQWRRARGFRVFVLDSYQAIDDYMVNHYGI